MNLLTIALYNLRLFKKTPKNRLIRSPGSIECERVFSAAKKTITPERNTLSNKVIEACECLKAWWRNKVISGVIKPKASGPKRKAVVMKKEDEVLA
jgi:hypothetical protein